MYSACRGPVNSHFHCVLAPSRVNRNPAGGEGQDGPDGRRPAATESQSHLASHLTYLQNLQEVKAKTAQMDADLAARQSGLEAQEQVGAAMPSPGAVNGS